jgi:hypothetical protein
MSEFSSPVALPTGLTRSAFSYARRVTSSASQSRLRPTSAAGKPWVAAYSASRSHPPAPAGVRVHSELCVFVVAADWAIWFTRFEGKLWKPSLGGRFVSDSMAIALFPGIDRTQGKAVRIDVFGVRSGDHVLLHNWLEKGLVNRGSHGPISVADGPTAIPPGHYKCAPGAGALTSSAHLHGPAGRRPAVERDVHRLA